MSRTHALTSQNLQINPCHNIYLIINKCVPFHILQNLSHYYEYLRNRSISDTGVFGYVVGI
jgi:hypothetical protein